MRPELEPGWSFCITSESLANAPYNAFVIVNLSHSFSSTLAALCLPPWHYRHLDGLVCLVGCAGGVECRDT